MGLMKSDIINRYACDKDVWEFNYELVASFLPNVLKNKKHLLLRISSRYIKNFSIFI